jgi:hypothetical protein
MPTKEQIAAAKKKLDAERKQNRQGCTRLARETRLIQKPK